ncbi:TlpA family protein disulfide reductase [Pedobacter montanisoli]|uniref:TlpA family protein disulfide reductase n=1 Tax=Pedobacter montanisoli TaxID=2923277 RepID=A0ABS9ZW54_9SPHI|nr:TlpA disulfide reductase family protein [Pedobacter montanisoli]MCJ0742543.1 TlpA family protein disulfide reductase [Pedobacter montanisoli]
MRFRSVLTLLSCLMFLSGCQPSERTTKKESKNIAPAKQQNEQTYDIAVDQASILKDFITWYTYDYKNINLTQNFIGLDADSIEIDKALFLTKLKTGNYIPFKIKIVNNIPVYQLSKNNNIGNDVRNTIKQKAEIESFHFQMEGKEFPDFNFTDLQNRTYNSSNTKDKVVLLKCWFINCVACVNEFPELNALVDKYPDRKDILFISLAIDNKSELKAFLKKKEFKYAVIPDQENFMRNKLNVQMYPTHILINKKGEIVKETNDINDILPFFEEEILKL